MVIDSSTVITGSFNFTENAKHHNAKNLVIIRSAPLALVYTANRHAHALHSRPPEVSIPSVARPSFRPATPLFPAWWFMLRLRCCPRSHLATRSLPRVSVACGQGGAARSLLALGFFLSPAPGLPLRCSVVFSPHPARQPARPQMAFFVRVAARAGRCCQARAPAQGLAAGQRFRRVDQTDIPRWL